MGYWKTTEEMGLTPEQIDVEVEKLWKANTLSRKCPDCGVLPGKVHDVNCDVARCTICREQAMCCEHKEPEKWSGLWPGVKECYDAKLICYDSMLKCWCFDLNTWTVRQQTKTT